MKKTFAAVLLWFCLMSVYGQPPHIPNGGFEEWQSKIIYESPLNWITSADVLREFIGTATKWEDSAGENYSLRLESIYNTEQQGIMIGIALYGSLPKELISDVIDTDQIDFSAFSWDRQLDQVSFSARHQTMEGDAGLFWIALFRDEELIGGALHRFRGETGEWNDFSLEVGYIDPENTQPDALAILVSSSSFAFDFDPEEIVPAAGSWLMIDNIGFSYLGEEFDLPNGDFSQWEDFQREDPTGWISSNHLLGYYNKPNVLRSENAYSGNYAARIETVEHEVEGIVRGLLKTGDNFEAREGFAAAAAPEFIEGAYILPDGSDPATIMIISYDAGGAELGSTLLELPNSTEYKKFISRQLPQLQSTPATVHIEILAGETPGSAIYIDNMAFKPGRVVNIIVVNQFNEPVESTVTIDGDDLLLLGSAGGTGTGPSGVYSTKLADGNYVYSVYPTDPVYDNITGVSFTVDGRNITIQAVVELPDENLVTILDGDVDKVYFQGDFFEARIENPVFTDGTIPELNGGIIDEAGIFRQVVLLENMSVSTVAENGFTVSGTLTEIGVTGVMAFEVEIGGITTGPVRMADQNLFIPGSGTDFGMAIAGLAIPEGEPEVSPQLHEFDNLYDTDEELGLYRQGHGSIIFEPGLNIADSRNRLRYFQEGVNILSIPEDQSYYAEIDPLSLPFLAGQQAVIRLENYLPESFSIRKTSFGSEADFGSDKDEAASASASMIDGSIEFTVDGFSRYSVLEEFYRLTIVADPPEGGTATDLTGDEFYPPGATISLEARENEEYLFAGWWWNETLISEEHNFIFTMPSNNAVVTSLFEPLRYPVTIIVERTDGSPVSGAIVNIYMGEIQVETIMTGNDGKAVTALIPGDYDFDIAADDFVSHSGSFTLGKTEALIEVILLMVGVETVFPDQGGVLIYPNPSDGIIRLEYSTTTPGRIAVNISDMSGRRIFAMDISHTGKVDETVDLRHLPPGIYILMLNDNGRIISGRLLIR